MVTVILNQINNGFTALKIKNFACTSQLIVMAMIRVVKLPSVVVTRLLF